MTEQANHHFVPKFYFRNFSEDGARIHLLLRPTGQVILKAPIKGQCAKHRFYGATETERLISGLEGEFSSAIRDAIQTAWCQQDSRLSEDCVFKLRQATVFQRHRTVHEVDKMSSMMETSSLEEFEGTSPTRSGVKDREEIIRAIEDGSIKVTCDDRWVVMRLVTTAFPAVVLIADLPVWLIRNQTDLPFVFGDAPVVLYNSHYRNVTARGVLDFRRQDYRSSFHWIPAPCF